MTEEWRPISWTDGWYEVSSLGRVRSWRMRFRNDRAEEPTIMQAGPNLRGGYPVVRIRVPSDKLHGVHRLVCEAWHGPPGPGQTDCRHLDGDPENNTPSNLAWGTRAENMADSVRLGRVHRGDGHPTAKLTSSDVQEMRRLYTAGELNQPQLAKRFSVSEGHVCNVVNRKLWAHVL